MWPLRMHFFSPRHAAMRHNHNKILSQAKNATFFTIFNSGSQLCLSVHQGSSLTITEIHMTEMSVVSWNWHTSATTVKLLSKCLLLLLNERMTAHILCRWLVWNLREWKWQCLFFPHEGVCRGAPLLSFLCHKATNGKRPHWLYHRRSPLLTQWRQAHQTANWLQDSGKALNHSVDEERKEEQFWKDREGEE